jgi:hypothetical protein
MPVIVSEEDNGDLKVEVSDDALEVADEEAMHGCWFCNAPLSIESFKTECQPA